MTRSTHYLDDKRYQLAVPYGPWILRGRAQQQFNLAPSDLDAIFPIEITDGPYVEGEVKKYNLRDVEALAQYLMPTFGPGDLAGVDGMQVTRNTAIQQFNLRGCQLNRIKPTANANGMKTYNLHDVEELKDLIDYRAAHPKGRRRNESYWSALEDQNVQRSDYLTPEEYQHYVETVPQHNW
ncbi:hypothetical protein NM688_g7471 [Phlebia brevispora]|uniref:Uncharacterized protein n=1 Tax=Phlebia brevispora TaxID=194682 RepID=A0ACC1S4T8_9APHY|nr:hypothetical protein NM688_g7471 [Phlebia brevispora]